MTRTNRMHYGWLGRALLILLLCSSAGLSAVVGNPFPISTADPAGLPDNEPHVAFGNNCYLVVYTHWTQDSQQQVSGDIYGAFVWPRTHHVVTVPIDTYDSSSSSPAVAYDPDNDRYLLAYEDMRSYADPDLYIRLLDGDGQTLAEQYLASTYDYERTPDVAYAGNGRFVVVWSSTTDPNLPIDSLVLARTVSYSQPDFTLGDEQLVNADTSLAGLIHPKVAVDASGQCLVVWQWPSDTTAPTPDQWTYAIQGRALDNDALPIGTVTTLSQNSADSQTRPALAYDSSDNQFCVTWQDLVAVGNNNIAGTLACISQGQVAATTPCVIATGAGDHTGPAVSWNDGKHLFQVTWEVQSTPTHHDVYASDIEPDGQVGSEFPVTTSLLAEAHPALVRGKEQFLVVWEDAVPAVRPATIHGAFLYDVAPPPHVTGFTPSLLAVQYKPDSPNQVQIQFDQPVQITSADVIVQGLLTGLHNDFALSYDTGNRLATLSWARVLGDDTYVVTVKDTVIGSGRLQLDGEMNLLQPGLPSGDGVAGGDFQGLVYRLVGDSNGDRSVDMADLLALASVWGLRSSDPGFDARSDLNNDGFTNVVDLLILAEHWGRKIPVGP
jgi:hypothetical protein